MFIINVDLYFVSLTCDRLNNEISYIYYLPLDYKFSICLMRLVSYFENFETRWPMEWYKKDKASLTKNARVKAKG